MSDFSNENTPNPVDSSPQKLPGLLNVLSILTLIGCGFVGLSGIYSYFTVCESIQKMEELDLDSLGGGAMGKMMENATEMLQKQCDHKMVILIITLVSVALCVVGALQMRKLSKSGFLLYTVGELLYPIASVLLLGLGSMAGLALVSSLLFPVVFIILYATQLKYMR